MQKTHHLDYENSLIYLLRGLNLVFPSAGLFLKNCGHYLNWVNCQPENLC